LDIKLDNFPQIKNGYFPLFFEIKNGKISEKDVAGDSSDNGEGRLLRRLIYGGTSTLFFNA